MRRIAFFLTLLLGAAAAIVWCLREKVPPAGAAPTPRVDAAEDGKKDGGAADRADDSAKTERSRLAASGADSMTWHLRFVAEGSRLPLAGVEVRWFDAFDAKPALALRPFFEENLDQFLQQHGRRDVADAQGRLDIVTKDDVVTLAARHQDRYVERLLRHDSAAERDGPFAGEHVIELPVDRQLTLRAVDPRGNAVAGARLVVDAKRPVAGAGPKSLRFTLDPTDAQGLAVFAHSYGRLRVEAGAATARALLAGDETPPIDVDLRFPPSAPVAVSLPDTGSVEVAILWPDGRPWTIEPGGELTLRVRQEEPEKPDPPEGFDEWSGSGIWSFEFDHEGRTSIAPVRCGARLSLASNTLFGGSVDGPKSPGERVQVTFRLRDDSRVLRGRILKADDSPFVGAVTLVFEGEHESRMQIGTAHDGGFSALVPFQVGDQSSLWVVHHVPGSDESAEVALPGPLVHGVNELGDIVLRPPQLLAAGRIIDMAGKPVDGVVVSVERAPVGDSWHWEEVAHVKTDASGRFEARGAVRTRRHRLDVRGDILKRDPIEFEPGTKDLTVRVARGASLTATFVSEVDPPVVLRQGKDTARWMPSRGKERHDLSDGRYRVRWTGLTAGPHRLVVQCPGCPPIVELAVDVPANGEADDARLHDIDLRGRIHTVAIQVRSADGRPFAGEVEVLVHAIMPVPDWVEGAFREPGDVMHLLVSQPVELAVLAKDHRGRILSSVFGDTTVVLEPAPAAKLSLPSLAALPDGVTAEILCEADEESPRPFHEILELGNRLALEKGCATLRAEGVGALRLSLVLHARLKDDCLLSVEPKTIDPVQLHDGQEIALRCDADELQKALASLTGR